MDLKNKKILILDDMISTGKTMLETVQLINEKGAKEIRVYATHGIFTNNSIKEIEKSNITQIYVTNSFKKQMSSSIEYIDISDWVIKKLENHKIE